MKIVIVDDHEIILDSLSMLLGSVRGIEILDTFSNGTESLDFLAQNQVDVVIVDYNMPDINGLELTYRIRETSPDTKVLFLTVSEDVSVIRDAFKAGVAGYVMKRASKKELQIALEVVQSGKRFFSESVIFELLNPNTSTTQIISGDDHQATALTNREIEIIKLIANEMSSVEIGERLFISPATVETHRHNVLRKLNVRNSIGVVKYAIRAGLLG